MLSAKCISNTGQGSFFVGKSGSYPIRRSGSGRSHLGTHGYYPRPTQVTSKPISVKSARYNQQYLHTYIQTHSWKAPKPPVAPPPQQYGVPLPGPGGVSPPLRGYSQSLSAPQVSTYTTRTDLQFTIKSKQLAGLDRKGCFDMTCVQPGSSHHYAGNRKQTTEIPHDTCHTMTPGDSGTYDMRENTPQQDTEKIIAENRRHEMEREYVRLLREYIANLQNQINNGPRYNTTTGLNQRCKTERDS